MDEDRDTPEGNKRPDSDGHLPGEILPAQQTGSESARSTETRSSRRRRSWLAGCLLALLGASIGGILALLIGRGANHDSVPPVQPSSGPSGYETRLIFSPTPERPAATPDIIPAESSVIYCFYELARVAPNAPLSARWWREGEALGKLELRDLQRDPEAQHATGRFSIPAPKGASVGVAAPKPGDAGPSQNAQGGPTEAHSGAAGFAPGIYEVELTSPAAPEVVARASFMALPRAAKILQGGGEPSGPPAVRSLQTAVDVGEDGKPTGAAVTFPPEVKRIYAVFDYAGVPPGALLTVRWFIEDTEIEKARSQIAVAMAEGRSRAWLQVGQRATLPPAQYRVGVFYGDEQSPLATTGFRIEAGAPKPSANIPQ